MTTAEVKNIFYAARDARIAYNSAVQRAANFRNKISCGKNIRYDNSGAAYQRDGNPVENSLVRLADLDEKADRLKNILEEKQAPAKQLAGLLRNDNQRRVVWYYFVCGMSWEEVAKLLNCTPRHAQRINGYAIKNISEKISKNT